MDKQDIRMVQTGKAKTFLRINKFSLLPRRQGETPADVLSGLLGRAFS